MKPNRRQVTVFQPYVPKYRVPLFDLLAKLLENRGMQLVVAHSMPSGSQAARADAATGSWSEIFPQHALTIAGHNLRWRRVSRLVRQSILVIGELAGSNLESYLIAAQRKTPALFWGHGKSYVFKQSELDTRLELWMIKRSRGVLVYTDSGKAHLVGLGIEPEAITVLYNTTDTTSLRHEISSLTASDIDQFRLSLDLPMSNVCLFVGALDPSKRLDLALDAVERARKRIPDVTLIVAGSGPLKPEIEAASKRLGNIRTLPRTDVRTLALLGAVSDLFLLPGRVGLAAVDAMTLGLPVATTDFGFHAPEREYLEDGFSWSSVEDGAAYSDLLVTALLDRSSLAVAQHDARQASDRYSIEAMASAMFSSIELALE